MDAILLITTCYKSKNMDLFSANDTEQAIYLEYYGNSGKAGVPVAENIGIKQFKGDGDFRSAECIELLKQADIVVTNPPFSLFREYIAQLIEHDKKFIVVGNQNSITYNLLANSRPIVSPSNTGTAFPIWRMASPHAPFMTKLSGKVCIRFASHTVK